MLILNDSIFWVGIRESDISACNMFKGSITLFGSGKGSNFAYDKIYKERFDYSANFEKFYKFVNETAKKVIRQYSDCKFMFYDQSDLYYCDLELFENRTIKFNKQELLLALTDKFSCKNMLKSIVDILPYTILYGNQITYQKMRDLFVDKQTFVVQSKESCGGVETFILSEFNEEDFKGLINKDVRYSVSPFIEAIPINIHAIISKNKIDLFQPSVQIIDSSSNRCLYKGGDFSLFTQLTQNQQEAVYKFGEKITEYLKARGYLGILGIDLLLSEDGLYFMEINPRFQASSFYINKHLKEKSLPTLQELSLSALDNYIEIQHSEISGSFYNYVFNSTDADYLHYLKENLNESKTIDDSVDINTLVKGSYYFKAIFDFNIVSNNSKFSVFLHPNLTKPFSDDEKFYLNDAKLKIALLNHGIRISNDIENCLEEFDTEEFNALTFELTEKNSFYSVPIYSKLTQISPFYIKKNKSTFSLFYLNIEIGKIRILQKDKISEMTTNKGTNYPFIAYKGFDRLKINHTYGCKFSTQNLQCKFCDMPASEKEFDDEEILEVIESYKNDKSVTHFLIGGGTDSINSAFEKIIFIAKKLSCQKLPIYAMTIPPNNKDTLYQMKDSGITEVAFNIECFNEEVAKNIMPGKSKISRNIYIEKLKIAKQIWTDVGAVRCMVILGLDSFCDFSKGIEELANHKIMPILSILRPIKNTSLENWISLDDKEIYKFYSMAKKLCMANGIALGPSCKICQSNVLG